MLREDFGKQPCSFVKDQYSLLSAGLLRRPIHAKRVRLLR